jgi:hypothetical protein
VSGGSFGSVGYSGVPKTARPNVRTPTADSDAKTLTNDLLGSPAATRSARRSPARSLPTGFCRYRCFPIRRRRSSGPGKRRATLPTTAPCAMTRAHPQPRGRLRERPGHRLHFDEARLRRAGNVEAIHAIVEGLGRYHLPPSENAT